jgi:hypothetical protein
MAGFGAFLRWFAGELAPITVAMWELVGGERFTKICRLRVAHDKSTIDSSRPLLGTADVFWVEQFN